MPRLTSDGSSTVVPGHMVYIWVQTLVGFLVHFSRVQEMDGDQMELLVNGLWPFSGAGWLWRPLSSGMTPVISLTLVERECCCSKKHMEGWLWPGLLYMPHCKKKKKNEGGIGMSGWYCLMKSLGCEWQMVLALGSQAQFYFPLPVTDVWL